MKIYHVVSSIDPAQGGPQAGCLRLAAAQAALGHEVEIISYGGSDIRQRALSAAHDVPHLAKVRWHLLADPDRIERVLGLSAARVLRNVLKDASFVHIHGVWEPILKHAARIARSLKVPYCVQPHGMLDVWSMRQKRLKKRVALLLGYRKMLNGAKFIHALNTDEANLLDPLGLTPPRLVIPNGIFLEEFADLPGKGYFAERFPQLQGKRVVLFLSRLHTKKGLDILAAAFSMLAKSHPDVDLAVAGPDGGAKDGFVSLVKDLGITDRVHLTGPIYGAEKLRALMDAACFCLPSRQEGFSVAITEALACGLPVVISEPCHFPEVRTAHAGAVVALEPANVAAAIGDILDNPDMAAIMGENGKRLVHENYTWPRVAELTLQGYASPSFSAATGSANLRVAPDHS